MQGVAWDQASGVAVARPLVRMRMPAFPDYAPEQGVGMTETGRLFVSVNPWPAPRGGRVDCSSPNFGGEEWEDNWDQLTP